jgi:hypothetical protein
VKIVARDERNAKNIKWWVKVLENLKKDRPPESPCPRMRLFHESGQGLK